MDRGPAIFLLLLALVVGGFFALDAFMTRTGRLPPERMAGNPLPQTLPADAHRLSDEVLPDSLMWPVARAATDVARAEAGALWQGYWTPEAGWSLVVEATSVERSGLALRCFVDDATIVGGGFWVIAVVDANEPPIARGTRVRIFGQINAVERVEAESSGGLPVHRIVLERSTVLKRDDVPDDR